MFNGIKPATFLSTHQEWHAFVIGFFEVLCPWKPRQPICNKSQDEMKGEYHYYAAGRASGFITLMLLCIALAKLVKEVLL